VLDQLQWTSQWRDCRVRSDREFPLEEKSSYEQTSRRADEQTSRRADGQMSRRADEQTSRREHAKTNDISRAHLGRAVGVLGRTTHAPRTMHHAPCISPHASRCIRLAMPLRKLAPRLLKRCMVSILSLSILIARGTIAWQVYVRISRHIPSTHLPTRPHLGCSLAGTGRRPPGRRSTSPRRHVATSPRRPGPALPSPSLCQIRREARKVLLIRHVLSSAGIRDPHPQSDLSLHTDTSAHQFDCLQLVHRPARHSHLRGRARASAGSPLRREGCPPRTWLASGAAASALGQLGTARDPCGLGRSVSGRKGGGAIARKRASTNRLIDTPTRRHVNTRRSEYRNIDTAQQPTSTHRNSHKSTRRVVVVAAAAAAAAALPLTFGTATWKFTP
jgi:hypothetical protein